MFMDFANMGKGDSPYTQALARAEAVSYTHLDVYKRQVYEHLLPQARIENID